MVGSVAPDMGFLSPSSVFTRYPRLLNLRGRVPDEVVEAEVGRKEADFEKFNLLATGIIPTVRLCDVFPSQVEEGRVVLDRFLGQWGNVTIEELAKICLIVTWLKPRRVFEFGTFNGLTTRQIALNTPDGCTVFTLDVDPRDAASLEIGEIDQFLAEKKGAFSFEVGHYYKQPGIAERVRQLWGDSRLFDFSPFEGTCDLVFVDAGHTYDCVKSDTENALKMLSPRGVLLWHDYLSILHPGVTKYLWEFAESGRSVRHLRGTNLAVHWRQ